MASVSPTVVLAPRATADSQLIWRACLKLEWNPVRLQGWRVPEELKSCDSAIVIYGEPLFAEAVADQLGLVLLEPSVDWLTLVPRDYLARKIQLMPLELARSMATAAFVKPADGKIFEPKVYASGQELPGSDQVDQDILVLRSGVVDYRLEVRCFVQGREVITLSPYWRDGELAQEDRSGSWPFHDTEEDEARNFALTVLGDERVPLSPACTLDVGRLADGTWAIIEANPCWGAGLYGCDPVPVLEAIRAVVCRRDELSESDKQWVSKRRSAVHGA